MGMLIFLIGAKGGVGTTSLARRLAKRANAVAVDLADGQLAARLGRRTWRLSELVFTSGRSGQQMAVDSVVERTPTLLWVPQCSLKPNGAVDFIRAVADRTDVVVDGGIDVPLSESPQPPREAIANEADQVVIVTEDSKVAQYHERELRQRFPDAAVVSRQEMDELMDL